MSDRPLDAALTGWLAERLGAEVAVSFHGPVPTGNSNVTMPFTAARCDGGDTVDLVLRMQVPDNQIFLDADVIREFEVLQALTDHSAAPVPRPRWAEADADVLGHPFFVMDKVAGTVPTGSPTVHAAGWLTERSPAEVTASWASALDAIASVAATDWSAHLPFLAHGSSGTTLGTRLDHLRDWYDWVADGRRFPVTDAALDHLVEEMPDDTGEPVLCWGDARIGNTMFGADARVAALLDWELASIGPAGIDLGWWLAFDEFTTRAHGVAPVAGYPGRDETIDRYEAAIGRPVANVRWYEIHCAWVLTVTVIRMADIAVATGRLSPDNRMGHGNLTAQMLARWLDLPVPPLDRDYATRRGLPVP